MRHSHRLEPVDRRGVVDRGHEGAAPRQHRAGEIEEVEQVGVRTAGMELLGEDSRRPGVRARERGAHQLDVELAGRGFARAAGGGQKRSDRSGNSGATRSSPRVSAEA